MRDTSGGETRETDRKRKEEEAPSTHSRDRRNNRGIHLPRAGVFFFFLKETHHPIESRASNRATGSRIREETKPKKHNARGRSEGARGGMGRREG